MSASWQTGWLSGGHTGRLPECSTGMGKAHLVLQWPKLLWSHLWTDHMYFFAHKWRFLSTFSCFAMEGSHRGLKRMPRDSGSLSLLRGCLGVQVVVDKHTPQLRASVERGGMLPRGPCVDKGS